MADVKGEHIYDSLTTKRCLKDQIMPEPDHTVVIVEAGPTGLALGAEPTKLVVHVTGRCYFPSMYAAILPMIPGIYGIRKLLIAAHAARKVKG